jgi:hypothetical protein
MIDVITWLMWQSLLSGCLNFEVDINVIVNTNCFN